MACYTKVMDEYRVLLQMYYEAELLVIGETSSTIKEDQQALFEECDKLSRENLDERFEVE